MIRGLVFPLSLHISNILFGKNSHGLLIFMYIFYLFMLKILDDILNDYFEKKSKKTKIYKILIYILVIINPIIFGYYHSVLTEFMAITISLIACYLSYKFIDIDYNKDKKTFYKFLILFSILTIFSYHLKQTYITTTLCPILIATLISCLKNKNIKNIISKLSSFFLCCLILIISILMWNKFLSFKGIDIDTDRNATNLVGINILKGINVDLYEIDNFDDTSINYLSKEDMSKLKNKSDDYYIIDVNNNNKVIDQNIIKKDKNGAISTKDAVIITIKIFFKHPNVILKEYFANYMALINLYGKTTDDLVNYKVEKKIDLKYCHENCAIAYATNDSRVNVNYLSEELANKVVLYEVYNNPPIFIRKILNILEPIYEKIYQLMYVLMPFMLISNIVLIFINKKSNKISKNKLIISLILLGFTFLHMMSCVILYLTIDRYSIASFIPCLVGEFLLVITIFEMF